MGIGLKYYFLEREVMMGKKKLAIVLALVFMLGLVSSCGKQSEESLPEESAIVETEDVQEDNADVETADDVEEEIDETPITFSDADLLWALPKGFVALEGEEGVYVPKSYPKDTSTITYVIGESDIDISTVPKDEFEQMMEEDYLNTYGDQVDIKISNYEKGSLNGRNTLRIDMEYEFKGTDYEQIEFMIFNGDESHIINFLQEKGGKWMDGFEDSIASMTFAQ